MMKLWITAAVRARTTVFNASEKQIMVVSWMPVSPGHLLTHFLHPERREPLESERRFPVPGGSITRQANS